LALNGLHLLSSLSWVLMTTFLASCLHSLIPPLLFREEVPNKDSVPVVLLSHNLFMSPNGARYQHNMDRLSQQTLGQWRTTTATTTTNCWSWPQLLRPRERPAGAASSRLAAAQLHDGCYV
jgi:hypothetical protein